MAKKVTEAGVVELWKGINKRDNLLQTVDDRPVRILYPGRPSDEPGADFLDAVVDINGVVTKGNIEVHVRTADWQAHRHYHDAAYNGVILHVVLCIERDAMVSTSLGLGNFNLTSM
jgi:hypothetical protein